MFMLYDQLGVGLHAFVYAVIFFLRSRYSVIVNWYQRILI